jgi:hypothetical protein
VIVERFGAPELKGQFDMRAPLLAGVAGAADALKAFAPPEPADEYGRYAAEEQAAGRDPLARLPYEQAQKGNGFSVTTPDGTSVNYGGAQQFGMLSGQDPAMTGTPRNAAEMGKGLSKADVAMIEEERARARAAGDMVNIAGQMKELAPNLGYTGPGGTLYGAVDDAIGVLPGDSGARGAFRSLATEAQLTFTEKTKGAITDREMANFRQAVPNLSQTPEGNAMIADALIAGSRRSQMRAQFFEQYAAASGSLQGAQAAWQGYMEANPLIENQGGRIQINGEGDPSAYLPGGSPAQATGGPSRVSSDAEYDALPSGATFIAPDGTTRRKP